MTPPVKTSGTFHRGPVAVATSATIFLLTSSCATGEAPLIKPPETTVAVRRQIIPEPPVAAVPDPAPSGAGPQVLTFPKEPFRLNQPEAGKPRPFRLPGITRFQLPGNIDVFLVERHTLPTISMKLVFDGGDVNDPPGKEGLASVCMSMLAEGTKKLDKIAFEEALADIGSGVSAWADTDEQGVSMYTLTRSLDRTLALWSDALLQPAFRKADLDRVVQRRLESLKQTKATVSSAGTRIRGAISHGKQHAFGRMTTETSYAALTPQDCVQYHGRWLKPAGARLFVVGDIDEAGVRTAVAARLATWSGKAPRSRPLGKASGLAGRIFFLPIAESAQSAVRLFHLGPQRNASDYFATQILERVLGGGFSSRINMNLREDKGWAYGARGGFAYDMQNSIFYVGASVQTDHTVDSLLELYREVGDLHGEKRPVTDVELDREKQGTILSLPGQFATARQTLDMYTELIRYKLPLDYWNKYVPAIEATSIPSVMQAATRHIKPDKLIALVVGDADKVLPGLLKLTAEQSLGKGDLVMMDPDAKIVERVSAAVAKQRLAALPPSPKPETPEKK